jgi:hypothetical protein
MQNIFSSTERRRIFLVDHFWDQNTFPFGEATHADALALFRCSFEQGFAQVGDE